MDLAFQLVSACAVLQREPFSLNVNQEYHEPDILDHVERHQDRNEDAKK